MMTMISGLDRKTPGVSQSRANLPSFLCACQRQFQTKLPHQALDSIGFVHGGESVTCSLSLHLCAVLGLKWQKVWSTSLASFMLMYHCTCAVTSLFSSFPGHMLRSPIKKIEREFVSELIRWKLTENVT
jgi:hypothetical protein